MDFGGQTYGSSKGQLTSDADSTQTPSSKKADQSQEPPTTSSQIVPGVDPPSPLRFITSTSNYTFTLRSSGFTAPSALDGLRYLIMATIGGIVRVDKEYMFDHSLPVMNGITGIVSDVKEACIENGYIVDGRWKEFQQDPSVRHKKGGKNNTEKKIYEEFGDLWKVIVELARSFLPKLPDGEAPGPTVVFHAVPDSSGMSERDSERTKPDGILELVKSSMIESYATKERNARGYCICDAACPIEVKPEDNDGNRIDNLMKLTHTSNRYFADDMRRRAVYAIGVEDTNCRVLTYTRTGVIACEPFNWIEDHESLIRVIVSLSFASEEELGYDPNIRGIVADPIRPPEVMEMTDEYEDSILPDESEGSRLPDELEDSGLPDESEDSGLPNESEDSGLPDEFEDLGPVEEVGEPKLRRSKRVSKKAKVEGEPSRKKRKKTEIDDEIAYEIDVGNRTFITSGRCISDYKADFFIGRATRVYQAYEKGDLTKTLYVLKISHVSISAAEGGWVEGHILTEINAKARRLGCDTYFPTIVCHGFPQISRTGMGVKSDSSNFFLRKKITGKGFYPGVIAVRTRSTSSKTAGSHRLHSQGETYSPIVPSVTGLPNTAHTNVGEFLRTCFPRRYQHRLVTREVGAPISNLMDLSKIFHALEKTSYALKWLHIMGYLHRDLSLGNILVLDLSPEETTPENRGMRVILNDYDSSKKNDAMTSSKFVRTGTPQFLSNELLQEQYLFIPRPTKFVQSHSIKPEHGGKEPATSLTSKKAKSKGPIKPHPNYLHDAESLMWIVFWFLCFSVPTGYNTATTPEQKHEQWCTGNAIFKNPQVAQTLSNRQACFIQDDVFQSHFESLPDGFQPFYDHLNQIRLILLEEYSQRESSPSFEGPISFLGCKGEEVFYNDIGKCFSDCRELVEDPKKFKSSSLEKFVPRNEDIQAIQSAAEDVDVEYDPNTTTGIQSITGSEGAQTSSADDTSLYDVFGPIPGSSAAG